VGGLKPTAYFQGIEEILDDRQIISEILSGDRDAFRAVIEEYQRLVAHIAFRMLPSSADREDVCQDVFLKVYQNLSTFKFKSKFSTWIARIAFNTCLNYLEKKRVELYDDISPDELTLDDIPSDTLTPSKIVEGDDLRAIIGAEISRLPARYRVILTLFHLNGMSYNEIGEILDIPGGTVKSHLFRARKYLKESLTGKYQEEELWNINT